MFRTRCIYILALIGTFIFFLFYKMWVAWLCLLIMLSIPLISLTCCLVAFNTVCVDVSAPVSLDLKHKAGLTVTVSGRAVFCSFIRLHISVKDIMGDETASSRYTIYDGGDNMIPLINEHCGAYVYTIDDLRIYDILGLFYLKRKFKKTLEVMVNPLPITPERLPNSTGFKARSFKKSRSASAEIYDIRDYMQGDSIKNIHWKMSAKKDRLIVKEPMEEQLGASKIVLLLSSDREEFDARLGTVLFTSRYLLARDTGHKIRLMPPETNDLSYDITSGSDLDEAIKSILHMKLPAGVTYAD